MRFDVQHTQEMIDAIGKDTLVIAMEEMAELQQQTSKLYRGKEDTDHLAEEIGDVIIGIALVIAQSNIKPGAIQEWIDYKTDRTRTKIAKGEFR